MRQQQKRSLAAERPRGRGFVQNWRACSRAFRNMAFLEIETRDGLGSEPRHKAVEQACQPLLLCRM
jgi:hypothetical protein